ncbi:MAG TPA: TfpX/TfpZ family type IV pilin accessory protein [Steroidobacteraceae bacterium]|nr:TfpX/TfpZ family type IV pilin accessory protein [Steroidobacteraceae bacterium]
MIVWRERFIATAIHFLVTLLLAGIAAALIFLVWFPEPLQTMVGGSGLFLLVVGCDLALGPLMSLVIYNSRKSRRELITDYAIVGVIQIGALVYGVSVVAVARPVFVAFNSDRYEVVLAGEIAKTELAAATDAQYRSLPWTGPRLVAVKVPPADRSNATMQAVLGNEEHKRPKFFVPLPEQLERIRAKSKPLEVLEKKKPAMKPLVDSAAARSGVPAERLAWLPVHHSKGFWTVLIDTADGKPVEWIDFDPY